MSASQRGYPLYARTGPLPPIATIARLTNRLPFGAAPGTGGMASFIDTVDGRPVGRLDSYFELRPGCHVITTESQMVMGDSNTVFRGNFGPRIFPLQMEAGHEYTVVLELRESMGTQASVRIFTVDKDLAGNQVRTIDPAKSEADIKECFTRAPPPA